MEFSRKTTDTGPSARPKEKELCSRYRHYRRFPTKALCHLLGFLVLPLLLLPSCLPIQIEPAPGWEEADLGGGKWWENLSQHLDPIHTPEGRPLSVRIYGKGPKTVMIIGGIHGSEPGSAMLVEDFERWIQQEGPPKSFTLLFVNPANPDGLAKGVRKNAHRVDLNRNFPASNFKSLPSSGPKPLSEPESRFLANLIKQFHPNFILSVHQPRRSVNWDGPARELAQIMAKANGYRLEASVGYPTPGSLGSWAGIDLQIPIITLELPRFPDSQEGFFADNKEAILLALHRVATQ